MRLRAVFSVLCCLLMIGQALAAAVAPVQAMEPDTPPVLFDLGEGELAVLGHRLGSDIETVRLAAGRDMRCVDTETPDPVCFTSWQAREGFWLHGNLHFTDHTLSEVEITAAPAFQAFLREQLELTYGAPETQGPARVRALVPRAPADRAEDRIAAIWSLNEGTVILMTPQKEDTPLRIVMVRD